MAEIKLENMTTLQLRCQLASSVPVTVSIETAKRMRANRVKIVVAEIEHRIETLRRMGKPGAEAIERIAKGIGGEE